MPRRTNRSRESSRQFWVYLNRLQIFLRVTVPLLIFIYPLPAALFSWVLDIDAYVCMKAGYKWKKYHILDKILDYWFFIIIFLYSFRLPIFPYILVLFVFRSIGQILSTLTFETKHLVMFPNLLDLYFLSYLVLDALGYSKFVFFGINNYIFLFVLLLVAILKEISINVKHWRITNPLGVKWSR